MADDMGEKTEAPSGRKLSEARDKGQIPKSLDLSAAVDLIGAFVLIWWMGPLLVRGCEEVMRRLLAGGGDWLSASEAMRTASWAMLRALMIAGPMMLLMMVVVFISQVQQVQLNFTLQPLMPKLERLNPIAGVGKLFSTRNLVKTLVSILKLCVVGTVIYLVVQAEMRKVVALPALGAVEAMGVLSMIVLKVVMWILGLMLAIGVVDWMYQRWQHNQDLKMTKQEVKDERKNSDGDPEVRAKRMKIAREMASQRAKNEVPKADVVVTNPTHYAVALKYDADKMAAPRVVAKGEDYMALRIREIAAAHGVPIVERPPLARALYAKTKVGQQISAELFEAVAEVLAYVYRLKRKAS